MMKKSVIWKNLLILILAFSLGLYAMPAQYKEKIPNEKIKNHLLNYNVNLGLDLAGGRQLDYKVDLSRAIAEGATEIELKEIVDGVAEVLRRRIDPDGTKELNIQTSEYAGEYHVLVEITADIDNAETREKLQKKIDLEFKELKDKASEEDEKKAKEQAEKYLAELVSSGDFTSDAEKLAEAQGITYEKKEAFQDQLPKEDREAIWNQDSNTVLNKTVKQIQFTIMGQQIVQVPMYSVIRVGEKQEVDREKTEEGEDFEVVRAEVSEADTEKLKVADLPEDLKEKASSLGRKDISEVLESDESYFIYKALPIEQEDLDPTVAVIEVKKSTEGAKEKIDQIYERVKSKEVTVKEERLDFEEVSFVSDVSGWRSTGLDGKYFKRAKVDQDPRTGISVVSVQFDEEGAKLFAEVSERNIGKPLAIFVGGELISAPRINEKITGGSAQITSGENNFIEAKKWAISLVNDLNAGAIGAPIELKGNVEVKASLGADSLAKSIKAGVIGLAILALYMVAYYRFLGLVAVFALAIYSIIMVAILSLSSGLVLTLAGIAGIILSIGMAVEANILIFERVKEELRDGKNFKTALTIGFDRAWTSIRDSNFSSLITCLVLYWFGTSIIKGFAVMLALGILISMFTAITVTKNALRLFENKIK
jgi:protein-export membrane protein SecD